MKINWQPHYTGIDTALVGWERGLHLYLQRCRATGELRYVRLDLVPWYGFGWRRDMTYEWAGARHCFWVNVYRRGVGFKWVNEVGWLDRSTHPRRSTELRTSGSRGSHRGTWGWRVGRLCVGGYLPRPLNARVVAREDRELEEMMRDYEEMERQHELTS